MTLYGHNVHNRALHKIQRIIAREGTAGGQRLQPWYREMIEDEIRGQDRVSALTVPSHQPQEDREDGS